VPCQGTCLGLPCGEDACGRDCGPCAEGDALAPGHHDLLNILARWYLPDETDYREGISSAEAPGGTFDGQIYYVHAASTQGGAPIYRLLGPGPDWMLSPMAAESGYTLDSIVGYEVLGSMADWTCPINRWFSAARADHATARCDEDLTDAGYLRDVYLGRGYPRYGTVCELPMVVEGEEVRLVANRVAGGAVSELWWGGRQFLNRHDFGRYLQTVQQNVGPEDRLFEAGDRYGCSGAEGGGWAHGAPLVEVHYEPGYLATTTRPLQWEPAGLAGGPDHPVLWGGTFAKEVQLGFRGPHVADWAVTINSPSGSQDLDVEVLRAALTSDFTLAYVYDAFRDTLTDVSADVPNGGCLEPDARPGLRPIAGAGILSTADGSHALGFYRRDERNAVRFCGQQGAGGGETGPDYRSVASVFQAPNGLAPGERTWHVYVLVGRIEDVTAAARDLYLSPP